MQEDPSTCSPVDSSRVRECRFEVRDVKFEVGTEDAGFKNLELRTSDL
jgi:hypothetical protein